MTKNDSPLAHDMETNFQKWFDDPVPADVLPPNHRIRRKRVDNWQKLSKLFSFGFGGAVFAGTVVGFILLYLIIMGWYSYNWPNPINFIILALVTGFFGGLYKGFIYKLREGTFYKDEL